MTDHDTVTPPGNETDSNNAAPEWISDRVVDEADRLGVDVVKALARGGYELAEMTKECSRPEYEMSVGGDGIGQVRMLRAEWIRENGVQATVSDYNELVQSDGRPELRGESGTLYVTSETQAVLWTERLANAVWLGDAISDGVDRSGAGNVNIEIDLALSTPVVELPPREHFWIDFSNSMQDSERLASQCLFMIRASGVGPAYKPVNLQRDLETLSAENCNVKTAGEE